MAQPSIHQSSQNKRDLWTRFVEGAVHVVETLCPSLERSLSWDFSDANMLRFEEECVQVHEPRVRDLHEEMGDFLPHAASAA